MLITEEIQQEFASLIDSSLYIFRNYCDLKSDGYESIR